MQHSSVSSKSWYSNLQNLYSDVLLEQMVGISIQPPLEDLKIGLLQDDTF